jgi:gamma-glutamylputrescine oxidase
LGLEHQFSYWERSVFIDNADVIIIGSGLVGLSAALRLKKLQPALKVLVLERGFLPSGASTKNAGFACFGTVSEQLSALDQSSEEEVIKLINYKWRGLQRLRQNLGDDAIDYHQHGGYELFMDDEADRADECIEQIPYLNKLLVNAIHEQGTYQVANNKIAAFGFSKVSRMIYNPFEGQLNTGKMMQALLKKVYDAGITVLNSCTITAIERQSDGIHLITTQGNFKTVKVILATNAFASQLFPELKVVPGRGQVLVTKPVSGLRLKGTYHFDEGYYYFRNIDGRILFGGGRNLDFETEATWEFGHTEKVKEKLISYLNNIILPGQPIEIDYWWSGIMGFGDDISPIVKQIEPNLFCAVRCNGMGVAMGSLVGEEVADLAIQ